MNDFSRKGSGRSSIRFAEREDLERVNELRRQVNDLHVSGRPETFKPGFPEELRDHIYSIFDDPRQKIVVSEREGRICAFAVLNHITRPETPFMRVRDYLDIDELCVDRHMQGRGTGTAFLKAIEGYLRERGILKIFLQTGKDMPAYSFYLKNGFRELEGHVSFSREIG